MVLLEYGLLGWGDWRSGSGGCLIGGIDIMDHMILKAIGSYTRCGLKVINIIKNIDWVQYRSNDKVHRPNGPAVVYNYGLSTWWSNGKVHRYYGPALMLEWHCHGNRIK